MTEKEKEKICRWWINHELRDNRITFSDKVYVSTADIQDFEQFLESIQDEPKFKVGDTIRSKYATSVHLTIEEIKDGKYYTTIDGKKRYWPIDKQNCYELVENSVRKQTVEEDCKFCGNTYEPVSEYLDEDDYFDEFLQELYIKYDKEVSIEKLLDIASCGAHWKMQQMMKDAISCTVYQNEIGGFEFDGVSICRDGITLDETKYKAGDKVKVIIIKEG